MKRRAFVAKSIFALLATSPLIHLRHAFADEKTQLPQCSGEMSIEGWDMEWGFGFMDGTMISPSTVSYSPASAKSDYLIHFFPYEEFNGEIIMGWLFTKKSTTSDKTGNAVVGAIMSVDGKAVGQTTTDENSLILSPLAIKALATGNRCQITSPYHDVTAEFSLTNWRKAMGITRQNLLKAKEDKANGICEEACFITTATCQVAGLPDDCFELTQLRRFRDRFMKTDAERNKVLEEYYQIAPRLSLSLSKYEFIKLYWRYILPCSLTAFLRLDRFTYKRYEAMMKKLKREYL